jgi:cyclohexyl-isocyanide hydratase
MRTSEPLVIGGLIFSDIDQADFTGPFEVLSRVPDSRFLVIGRTAEPIKDVRGLILTPEITMAETPALDVLLIPGGTGVNALMEDAETLAFVRKQAAGAKLILSVCTGALICGAAGLLKGRRATTHWASHHLLAPFGATPVDERVVIDEPFIFAAGVTSGIDGALQAAAQLRGIEAAQGIQLYLEYAPNPPFTSGSPHTAPAAVLAATQELLRPVIDARAVLVHRITSHA